MNILLISPFLSVEDRYGSHLGKVGPTTEPLGLAYLASSIIEKRKDYVEILDMAALRCSKDDLIRHLKKRTWNVVGVTILTPMYVRALEAIKIVKENTSAKILVGGPHVTIFPVETLRENKEIDIGVCGEGEVTIIELLDALEKNKPLKNIKGLVYRDKEKIKLTELRGFIKNIDEVPLPARDLLPIKKYIPAPTYYKKPPSLVMLTSRGCPYRCSYCSKIFGNVYRHHSVNRIIEEMNLLISNYNAKEIIFRDDTFTINQRHIKDLCRAIIKGGLHKKIKWTCMTRVNLVNYQLLRLMKKAGCWSMHYGIESGSQRLLNLIEKDITLKLARNAIKWTRKAGIDVKAFFMLGLPTETKEESLKTLKFMRDCGADWVQVTITTPYPGTKLYDLAKRDGTLKSFNWEDYQTWAGWSDKELVYVSDGRDADELKFLQKKAMKEFYLRPSFITKQILQIRSYDMFKKYLMGARALIKSRK